MLKSFHDFRDIYTVPDIDDHKIPAADRCFHLCSVAAHRQAKTFVDLVRYIIGAASDSKQEAELGVSDLLGDQEKVERFQRMLNLAVKHAYFEIV
jgi:hypothetical protein